MAGPVPFRTSNENKYTASFPSVLYYRDTFGLDPIHERRITDSMTTEASDDTVTTKSTVRTTLNIHHNPMMNESMVSRMSQSYHIEQLLTNRVITAHPRTLFILSLLMFATGVQLLMFATISVFFDGCPFFIGVVASLVMVLDAAIVFAFLRCVPTRAMLALSCVAASLSVIVSVGLFFWTARLISQEKERPSFPDYEEIALEEEEGDYLGTRYDISSSNPIVSSTRIAMNSLQLVFAPVHGLAASFAVYVLYLSVRGITDQSVMQGYFFSEPTIGHQKILVPIELRQVRSMDDDEPDNASIGVQTSGNRSNQREVL